uniref:Uncharacterized protein n=1 Tax=Candidatus Kentrum sp. DK TaxID=2126562 RepID=A0A450TGR8_9GAMM|nr:MAG: hypothetical protein BECKDK2373C_GA0170839_105921 [Candidatus Kentron sp. DK]VFJ66420.1 MAG: hypothetical protein BECKDK2373B_GA0170837_11685 [Candidatus Kentron sp. DK]
MTSQGFDISTGAVEIGLSTAKAATKNANHENKKEKRSTEITENTDGIPGFFSVISVYSVDTLFLFGLKWGCL